MKLMINGLVRSGAVDWAEWIGKLKLLQVQRSRAAPAEQTLIELRKKPTVSQRHSSTTVSSRVVSRTPCTRISRTKHANSKIYTHGEYITLKSTHKNLYFWYIGFVSPENGPHILSILQLREFPYCELSNIYLFFSYSCQCQYRGLGNAGM
jgi:hypothetical protein